jgi:hypothetical protein
MPAGVHEANPGWPKAIAANEGIVTPSTSFSGAMAPEAARSTTWAGTGCCSTIPSTSRLAESPEIASTTTSVVELASILTRVESIPTASQRARFILT